MEEKIIGNEINENVEEKMPLTHRVTVTYTWVKANGKIQTRKYERKKLITEDMIINMKSDINGGMKIREVENKYKLSRQTIKKYTKYNLKSIRSGLSALAHN